MLFTTMQVSSALAILQLDESILHLPPDIAHRRLSVQYRRRALQCHPDRCRSLFSSDQSRATAEFQHLQAARQAVHRALQAAADMDGDSSDDSGQDGEADDGSLDDTNSSPRGPPSLAACALRLVMTSLSPRACRCAGVFLHMLLSSPLEKEVVRAFQCVPRDQLPALRALLRDHRIELGITDSLWARLEHVIHQAQTAAWVYRLDVSLSDVLEHRFLRLSVGAIGPTAAAAVPSDTVRFVPLWRRESVFDLPQTDTAPAHELVVHCRPAHLPPGVHLAEDNTLSITQTVQHWSDLVAQTTLDASGVRVVTFSALPSSDPVANRHIYTTPLARFRRDHARQEVVLVGRGPTRAWGDDVGDRSDRTDVRLILFLLE